MGFTPTVIGGLYEADFSTGVRPVGVTDWGGGAPTYSVGAADWSGIQFAWKTTQLPADLIFVTRAKCHMNTAQNAQLCGVSDGEPVAGVGWASGRPVHIAYAAGQALAFWANSTEGNKDLNFTAGTTRIFEIVSDGVNITARVRNASTLAVLAEDTHAWGSAEAPALGGQPWFFFGHTMGAWGASADAGITMIEVMLGLNVTVTGLSTGNAVRLCDASDDSVLAQAVESGGSAVLDCGTVDWQGGTFYLQVFTDDSYADLLEQSDDYAGISQIAGGCEFAWATELPTISSVTTPARGGMVVTIVGVNFGATAGIVTVAGAEAEVLTWADTVITARLPNALPVGTAAVVVTVVGAGASNAYNITITLKTLLTYGTATVDLNDQVNYFIMQKGFRFPPPVLRADMIPSAVDDGATISDVDHYENRVLYFAVLVRGQTIAELDEKVNDLLAEIERKTNLVTFTPYGRSTVLYFDTYRGTNVELESSFFTDIRKQRETVVTWQCEAKPFARGTPQTIITGAPEGLNDDFEYGGDFDHYWTPAGNVTEDTTNVYTGLSACKLTSAAGTPATITDTTGIIVDHEKHYALQVHAKLISGTPTLSVEVACYDGDGVLLDTLVMVNEWTPTAAWLEACGACLDSWAGGYYDGVIHPYSDGAGRYFPDGTVTIKRTITNSTNGASAVTIDSLFFGCTEYVTDGRPVHGAFALCVPPADLVGDSPAPLDFTFENVLGNFTDLVGGQKKLYHDDYAPVVKLAGGDSIELLVSRHCSRYCTVGIGANLPSNPDFETISSGSGNTTVWANWTATRSGLTNAYLATTAVTYFAGSKSVQVGGAGFYSLNESLLSDGFAINTALPYVVGFAACASGVDRAAIKSTMAVKFYTGGGAYISQKVIWSGVPSTSWRAYMATLSAADIPATAATAKVALSAKASAFGGAGKAPYYGYHYWDCVYIGAGVDQSAEATIETAPHEGRVLPTASLSFGGAATYNEITVGMRLYDSQYLRDVPVTVAEQSAPLGDFGTDWREQVMLPDRYIDIAMPPALVDSDSDLDDLQVIMTLYTDPRNTQDWSWDTLTLLPVDVAYLEVHGVYYDLQISSSQGAVYQMQMPVDVHAYHEGGSIGGRASFKSLPDGINAAFVLGNEVDGDMQTTLPVKLTMTYSPRYRLIPT